ncbi:hypothetical protein IAR50_004924 [Cryptococcus sp. DSM 104548]
MPLHPLTPITAPAPSAAPPIMIALSGWPDAVYIASDSNPRERGRAGTATPPEVYDGVGGPRIVPKHISPAPGVAGGKRVALAGGARRAPPKSALPVIPGKQPASTSGAIARMTAKVARLPRARAILPKPAPVPAPAPSPSIAPQHSIFATTCPHLADPSLGPCPFPTHPHDIRGMFPPTSHLEKMYGKKVAVEPTVGKGKRPGGVGEGKGKGRAFLHKGRALPLVPSWSGAGAGVGDGEKANGREGDKDVEMKQAKLVEGAGRKRSLSPSSALASSQHQHPSKTRLLSHTPSTPSSSSSSASRSTLSSSSTPTPTPIPGAESGLLWKRVIVNNPEHMDIGVDGEGEGEGEGREESEIEGAGAGDGQQRAAAGEDVGMQVDSVSVGE